MIYELSFRSEFSALDVCPLKALWKYSENCLQMIFSLGNDLPNSQLYSVQSILSIENIKQPDIYWSI